MRLCGGHHHAVSSFFNSILPLCVPFGHPKGTEKVPATCDSAGGPLRGCSPLRTPKRRSRSKKAKPCRSAARFLTLFYFSPIDPSGAKTGRRRLAAKTMATIRQSRPARAVQCPTGALIAARPRNATPYGWGHTSSRGEHCSPVNWAITQTPAGAHCAPLHPLRFIENLGPEGVNMEDGEKALRKLQHSCNF